MAEDQLSKPPNIVEVLQSDEEVVWSGKERTPGKYYCCPGSIAFILPLVFLSPLPYDSPVAIVVYLYSIIVIIMSLLFGLLYPKWYRITNQRLLEMRGKRILNEVPLSRFGDRPLKELVAVRFDHHAAERSSPVNDIIFYDPDTLEPILTFNDIWYGYTLDLELIYDKQRCSACGIKVDKTLEKCLACGQPLV